MKNSIYKSYDELPLFLNADTVAKTLGIAISSCYELLKEKIFLRSRLATGSWFRKISSSSGSRINLGGAIENIAGVHAGALLHYAE